MGGYTHLLATTGEASGGLHTVGRLLAWVFHSAFGWALLMVAEPLPASGTARYIVSLGYGVAEYFHESRCLPPYCHVP